MDISAGLCDITTRDIGDEVKLIIVNKINHQVVCADFIGGYWC